MTILNSNGRLIDLSCPAVMGVLNVTPDSFYAGSRVQHVESALENVHQMIEEGMDILDIGAASSRPGAQILTAGEEWKRLSPILGEIIKSFPALPISVDTYWRKVAEKACTMGAHIVNDISAWSIDPELLDFIAESKIPYVLMHMQGTPRDMQLKPHYGDVISDVMRFLKDKIRILEQKGVQDIIIDPGFGFGKTLEHNYAMLRNVEFFRVLGYPVLGGISRKSMIYNLLNIKPEESLEATSALHLHLLMKGVTLLRVHDVLAARHMIKLFSQLKGECTSPGG